MSYITPSPALRRPAAVGATALSTAVEAQPQTDAAPVSGLHGLRGDVRNTTARSSFPFTLPQLNEVALSYDADHQILWQSMMPEGRPSFTPGLLRDLTKVLDLVDDSFASTGECAAPPISYLVLGSNVPTIFNLGGDLVHFMRLIEAQDRERLSWYARVCAEGQYRRAVDLNHPLCTIALVQGDALGGGFEAALANDVIIAERSASFGLPEVLFNLFPGMGALSFLARRLDPVRAERMILSGRVYSAEDLYEMGVVDRLVEDGRGIEGVYDFVREFGRARGARQALLKARRILQPISRQELVDIADLWVDAALSLGPSDLRRMQHLAKAQDRRWARLAAEIQPVAKANFAR
jgi:DSF synthase